MRRSSRVDANQPEIVSALRDIGCSVESLHRVGGGVPDILVGYRGRNYLMEIKNPEAVNRQRGSQLLPEQSAWHNAWRGLPVAVVRSINDALEVLGVTSGE